MTEAILHALGMAFAMGWEVLWPLFVGFALTAIVQTVASALDRHRRARQG